jgi:hypothetical protein
MNIKWDKALPLAGAMSMLVALLHAIIAIKGGVWYIYFGAGEQMAILSEQGSKIPPAITFSISMFFVALTFYSLSGCGRMRPYPLVKPALLIAGIILSIRGLMIFPLFVLSFYPEHHLYFREIMFCIIPLIMGVLFLIGWNTVRNDNLEENYYNPKPE